MNNSRVNPSTCPLCQTTVTTKLLHFTKYRYCKTCSLGWIIAKPPVSYEDSYYQSGSSLLAYLFIPITRLFYFIRESYVDKKNKSTWIDVGAGDGGFLETVSAKKKIGVETSTAGITLMKNKGIQTLTDKQFLKQKNINASVISFWHMLEHVDNPWDYLKAANKNIKKSGEIIIGVPNVESFELKIFKKHWFHLAPGFHKWFFSPKAMIKLLDQTGYKPVRIDFWSPEHHFAGLLQSAINATSNSDNVLHRLLKRRQTFSNITFYEIISIVFWCSIGLPFLFIFWIFSSVVNKSGTFIIVAKKK